MTLLRPLARLAVAGALPILVPALVALALWALPGDPASIVCPPGLCAGSEGLAARWHLDRGPLGFLWSWAEAAAAGDLGRSWRVMTGVPVAELVGAAAPVTLTLVAATGGLLLAGAGLGAVAGRPLRAALAGVGAAPAVVLALLASAAVDLRFGGDAFGPEAVAWRLVAAVAVLALADGALSGAVAGAGDAFARERAERYVLAARLRGEPEVPNLLPNLAPALAGQLRARLLAVLSGSVIVEAALRVDGVGDLLWRAALLQDFAVMMAAATFYAGLAAALLGLHAAVEGATGWWVRRAPAVEGA